MVQERKMANAAEWYNIRYRRLNYGSIELVSAYDPTMYPYNHENYRDMWHVPGMEVESTEVLVRRATRKGITVSITEHSGTNVETIKLN